MAASAMAAGPWPAWAVAWYSLLCAMALLNLGLTTWLLCCQRCSDDSRPRWYRLSLRVLGSLYVVVVAYRSFFPADYPHRYVFWDNMLSSILIHRAFATVEELAWVLQIVLVQSFCASQVKQCRASFALVVCVSTCMVLVILLAECFSFAGTISQAFCWFAWEETCWAVCFAMGLPVYLHLLYSTCRLCSLGRSQARDFGLDGMHFALVMTIFCLGYVPYMAVVDVPSYWDDFHLQRLQNFAPNSFAQGAWNALTFREPTQDLGLWQPSILWKTVYFTLGPWLSIALMTAPSVRAEAAAGKAAVESEVSSEV